MSLRRFNPKRDGNERPIIAALEARGATVQQLTGKGIPDLLIGFKGHSLLAEVKQPGETLNDGQRDWHRTWRGSTVSVLRSPVEAVTWLEGLAHDWALFNADAWEDGHQHRAQDTREPG